MDKVKIKVGGNKYMLNNNKIYRVGIYTRLSKEDGNVDESNSIET